MVVQVGVRLIYLCSGESQCMVASELVGSVAGAMPVGGQWFTERTVAYNRSTLSSAVDRPWPDCSGVA